MEFKTKEQKAIVVLNCPDLPDELKVELIGLLINQSNATLGTSGQLLYPSTSTVYTNSNLAQCSSGTN